MFHRVRATRLVLPSVGQKQTAEIDHGWTPMNTDQGEKAKRREHFETPNDYRAL
jgi:hypothetical protein